MLVENIKNNQDNVEKFMRGEDDGYVCMCCGKEVHAESSISFQGWNLVCIECLHQMEDIVGMRGKLMVAVQDEGARLKNLHEGRI